MNDRDRIKTLIFLQPYINTRELMDITGFAREKVYNHCSHLRELGFIESRTDIRNRPTKWVARNATPITAAQIEFLYRKRAA